MPLSQRAKQFAPFDALTGLSERLRQAEEEHSTALNSRTLRYESTDGNAGADADGNAADGHGENKYDDSEMPEE